jgi:hypothetical protein
MDEEKFILRVTTVILIQGNGSLPTYVGLQFMYEKMP